MKPYKWIISFEGNDDVEVQAFGLLAAVILAFAERIQKGLHTRTLKVVCVTTNKEITEAVKLEICHL